MGKQAGGCVQAGVRVLLAFPASWVASVMFVQAVCKRTGWASVGNAVGGHWDGQLGRIGEVV